MPPDGLLFNSLFVDYVAGVDEMHRRGSQGIGEFGSREGARRWSASQALRIVRRNSGENRGAEGAWKTTG
jgi:hypothetical protein